MGFSVYVIADYMYILLLKIWEFKNSYAAVSIGTVSG